MTQINAGSGTAATNARAWSWPNWSRCFSSTASTAGSILLGELSPASHRWARSSADRLPPFCMLKNNSIST
jgi:hypothetical protein